MWRLVTADASSVSDFKKPLNYLYNWTPLRGAVSIVERPPASRPDVRQLRRRSAVVTPPGRRGHAVDRNSMLDEANGLSQAHCSMTRLWNVLDRERPRAPRVASNRVRSAALE